MMAGSLPFLLRAREVVKKLKKAGAVSRETAKTIEELGLSKFEAREVERIAHWTFTKEIREIIDEKGVKRYYVAKNCS